MKENAWVPSTPAIHFPSTTCGASEALKHGGNPVENGQFPSILGDFGQGFGNFGRGCQDNGASPKTTNGFKRMEGNAKSLRKTQNPRKRGHKENDLNTQPRKRMRTKKHRPKVFDKSKPKKAAISGARKTKTPIPKTPGLNTPRNANHVKKESLNIPVHPVNDTRRPLSDIGCRGKSRRGKSYSKRKLDFCRENQVMDQNLNLKTGDELNLPFDASYHDLNVTSRVQNLVFSLKSEGDNEIGDKLKEEDLNIPVDSLKDYLKPSNDVETEIEVEQKHALEGRVDRFSGLKVYQRKWRVQKSILDKNSMASSEMEHKPELESKLDSANRFSPFKVYKRRSPKKTHIMDEKLKSCDGTKIEQDLQGPLDHKFSVSNFPNEYKKRRRKRQRRRIINFTFPALISRPQRKRKMSKRMNSYSIEENSKKKSSIKKCALNYTGLRKGKRSGHRIRRRSFSFIFKGFPSKVMRKKRSKMSSRRRKDFSSFTCVMRNMQDYITQMLKEHSPELTQDIKEHSPELTQDNLDFFAKALWDYLVQAMESLHICDEENQLVVRDQDGHLTSKVKLGHSKKRKQLPKVDLDLESIRAWNLLMEGSKDRNLLIEGGQSEDKEDKEKYWREQRQIFDGRVESFLARTHFIQGDRRFSQWKGSVVDSVVGVFLTQNVSDHLSSSAFINLAAKYPPPLVEDDDIDDYANEIQHLALEELSSTKCDELSIVQKYPSATPGNNVKSEMEDVHEPSFQMQSTIEKPKENAKEKQENKINWDDLRTKSTHGRSRIRAKHTRDSVNWEAVRQAPVSEVAKVIMERGMNNMLAIRIKDFLDRLVRDHGSIDLEWLRDVEQDKSKEYLLSITGLGLKSVECVRLLTLRHHAFPVDTNVARILVRLGWVPLQSLPDDLQIHLLNDYPLLETVQKYIWPRLCHLMIDILYEFHYHLITFGKLICTKKHPNCNACPMRAECKHFASACASAKLKLNGPKDQHMAPEPSVPSNKSMGPENAQMVVVPDCGLPKATNCEPIVQYPPSPEPEIGDIEDICYESNDEDIITIKLNKEEFAQNINNFADDKKESSKALVALSPEVASIPLPKLKYVGRLRTVHHVYELPDVHPLLAGFEKRDSDDRCPYLLAIWNSNELMDPLQDCSQGSGACGSREMIQYENDEIVRGTILIPIRTANRGSFPLNGTYFQTNEVIADQESSKNLIAIPRSLIWNLRRRFLYCGTSATSICRGMSMEEITAFSRGGYMCVRGFDRVIRAPRPLARRFHLCKTRKVDDDDD